MLKIEQTTYLHTIDHVLFVLEGGEHKVILNEKEIEGGIPYTYGNFTYYPVYSESEYNDEPKEIIGFIVESRYITIYNTKWYLSDNGDCVNEGNLYYNAYTKKSNFDIKSLPNVIKKLDEHFK